MTWVIKAERDGSSPVEQRVERQGTAWRQARRLFAAGYDVTGVQYSAEPTPVPLAVYRFDGIRFIRLRKLRT
jgi:hypothetical protein